MIHDLSFTDSFGPRSFEHASQPAMHQGRRRWESPCAGHVWNGQIRTFLFHLVMSYNSPTPYHLQFNIYIYNMYAYHLQLGWNSGPLLSAARPTRLLQLSSAVRAKDISASTTFCPSACSAMTSFFPED